MTMHASLLTAALLLSCLLSCSLASAACQLPVPKGMKAVPVGDNVIVNGRVMAIAQVQGPEPLKETLAGAEQAWKAAGKYDVRRQSITGWEILSAKGEDCLVTLQLTSRNGAFGYLAHSKKALSATATARSRGVPLPGDAKIESSVVSEDDGRRALVLLLSSRASLDDINHHFLQAFDANKWLSPRSHKISNKKNGSMSLSLNAQRGRERVEIVAWQEGKTQIMLTISDSL